MSGDERVCRYPCDCGKFPDEHCACMDGHASPPADTASTGADVEALARVLHDWVGGCCVERFDACVFDGTGAREEAARLLAYPAMRDMLAAHDAATADRVRREAAEGIRDELERMLDTFPQRGRHTRARWATEYIGIMIDRIAREQAR